MKQETEDKNLTRKDTLQENQELIITTHLKQSTKSTDFINEKSIEDDPIGKKSKKNTVGTKESILQEALKLFAQNGYEATSMSDIAKRLGISKAALYKHYQGKQEIFDQIVDRMNQLYDERSQKYHMPKGTFSQMSREYIEKPLEQIIIISRMLFQYWTEEEFPSLFRKVLTLEQYRNEKMAQLYRYYLTDGPIEFMTELFSAMLDSQENIDPKQVVLDFYGPIYMLICMYDIAEDKTYLDQLLVNHINHFSVISGLH